MTNQPYVKQYNEAGFLTNPITKDNPYLHRAQSTATKNNALKYFSFHHPITGEFVGKVKVGGNNRKWYTRRNGKKVKRMLKF